LSYFRQTVWYRLLLYAAMAAVGISAVLIAAESPHTPVAVAVASVALLFLGGHLVAQAAEKIDMRLARELDRGSLKGLHVYNKSFPGYRFVDIYRAVERYCEHRGGYLVIDTQHAEDLNAIVNSQFYGEQSGKIRPPTQVPKDVAYNREEFFPTDRFWVLSKEKTGVSKIASPVGESDAAGEPGTSPGEERADEPVVILRVRVMDYTGEIALEMASSDGQAAEQATEEIIADSIANSIYRNQLLQISFDAGVKDEFGEMDANGPFSLLFMRRRNVTREQIILDEEISRILDRNVFEFHRKREALQRHGVPSKKGVLFYGPPGTGKTYTCQYIYSSLKNVTTMVVTGQSLLHVKTICNLARMLQPTLLVLEDVDLIFSSREINLYSTALGDLMDELDGFQSDEPVTFLLTTNAIDRLEQAIKDRPGRINQCVYFGPPNAKLRKLYIERYLQGYDYSKVDLDAVVAETRGTSQAFLKELIYRAVQIALEDERRNGEESSAAQSSAASNNGEMVRLHNADFTTALHEMTQFDEKATGSIMGFRIGE